jgi:TetR/AcrR family transcriptional regulator
VSPRRSPAAGERQRDPERSRAAILDAALVEFGEHGFAGARTGAIARRAGVNAQLIAYYFDGKAGLYEELTKRWQTASAPLSRDDLPLHEVVANFVRASVANRAWSRLMIWEGLDPAGVASPDGGGSFASMVDGVHARQARGELAAELDPATVLIVLFSAALAPAATPQLIQGATGHAADSEAFLGPYVAHLRSIVERLGPR